MSNFLGDLQRNSTVANAVPLLARTTTANGSGYDNKLAGSKQTTAMLFTGAMTGTAPTLDVKVQQSVDNVTFTDIPGATFPTVSAADQISLLSFVAQQQYIRFAWAVGGTTPNFTFGVGVIAPKKAWGNSDGSGFVNDPAPGYVP